MLRLIRSVVVILGMWLFINYGGAWLKFWQAHRRDPQIRSIQQHFSAATSEAVEWVAEQTRDQERAGGASNPDENFDRPLVTKREPASYSDR